MLTYWTTVPGTQISVSGCFGTFRSASTRSETTTSPTSDTSTPARISIGPSASMRFLDCCSCEISPAACLGLKSGEALLCALFFIFLSAISVN
jgi:hypothetical protein